MGILVVVAGLSLTLGWPDLVARVAYAVDSGRADAAREQLKHAHDLSAAFENVVTAAKPSVVNISAIRRMEPRVRVFPGPGTRSRDPFREFFGEDFFERFHRQQTPDQNAVVRGGGTGVIVSSHGHILTNNHVVEDMDQVTVTLPDSRTFQAEIVGRDPKTDLAVIKVSAEDLKPAELGDSDQLNVGEWVLAVGNPFGLDHTVTAGIVSAKGRAYVGLAEYEDYIQTDAAINPGNSGGPLLNLEGQVIGINSAIVSSRGGYTGVGFAIPINMAQKVMEDLIADGKVQRGFLGVIIQNLTPDLAKSFGYDGEEGVLIAEVSSDGPAAKAGIKVDDIIVELAGTKMTNMNQLRNTVANTVPGTELDAKVFRDGKTHELKVKVGELDSDEVASSTTTTTDELGMSVETLTDDAARQLNLDGVRGVLVTGIEPGGTAERSGLSRYDVIFSVGGEPVENLSEFRSAMAKHDLDQGVRLKVKTRGASRYVFLKK
jgi:serine protease Do